MAVTSVVLVQWIPLFCSHCHWNSSLTGEVVVNVSAPTVPPTIYNVKHNKMQLNDSSLIIINIYIQYTVYIHIYIMHSSKHSQPCLLVRGLQSLSSVGHHVSRVEAGTEGRPVCHALLIELITGCWEETASDVSCHSGRAVCPHPPDKTGASSY